MVSYYQNESSGKDQTNSYQKNSIKKSRLESEISFNNSFSRYNPISGMVFRRRNDKYVNHFGGIPLGYTDNDVLIDSSDVHSLIIGATGSKKSRLIVMPSVRILADSGESMIISDPKSEIFNRTSGYLYKKGYSIRVINLREPNTGDCWNPLDIPYRYYVNGEIDKAYEFANDIANNLMLSELSLTTDPFWDYSSRDLFFGLCLLLFKYCKELNLNPCYCNISNILRLRNYLFKNYYSYGSSKINDENNILNSYMHGDFITESALLGSANAPEKTQASILSTFDEKMRSFAIHPSLVNMLSNNTVDIRSIGEKPSAVYIIMPDEKTTYHKLVSLFIKQSYEYLIYNAQKNQDGKISIRLNYILDEFSSLPAINDFSSMITAARSRNIRFNLVVQSKHQLIEKYKNETDTIQSNCSNWVFLTSREIRLLEEIALLCGKKNDGKSIVPPEALQHLNKEQGECLILSGRLYPYISKLRDINYYDKGEYKRVPLSCEKRYEYDISFDTPISTEDEESKNQNSIDSEEKKSDSKRESDDEYDLQKELEKKFDELFGPLDDD